MSKLAGLSGWIRAAGFMGLLAASAPGIAGVEGHAISINSEGIHEPENGPAEPDTIAATATDFGLMEIWGTDGKLKQRSVLSNPKEPDGPLGRGVYKVTLNPDGTFDERFTPAPGSAQPAFEAMAVPGHWRTSNKTDRTIGFGNRIYARLLEGQIENALIRLGFDSVQVCQDVIVLETASPSLRGTFAAFAAGTESKYIALWRKERNLLGIGSAWISHNSTGTRTGPEVPGTGFAPKFYNGRLGKSDSYPIHLGIVRSNTWEHTREAWRQLKAILLRRRDVNVERENGKALQALTSLPVVPVVSARKD